MSNREKYKEIVDALGELIRSHNASGACESNSPHQNPDESDHYIKTHREASARLRRIREEIEEIEAKKDYLEP